MTDALIAISQAMSADLEQMRAVSQNVANANTPGYRSVLLSPAPESSTRAPAPAAAELQTFVSLSQGPAISTGRSLDFSLSGNAYFCVQTPEGVRYTRDGNFHLDNGSQLVTAEGYKVLGNDGPISLPGNSVTVDDAGHISWNGKVQAQFAIAALPTGAQLEVDGKAVYRMTVGQQAGSAPAGAAAATSFGVRQGTLEGANVSTSSEALELIQISRHMESIQRAMLTYDQILNSGVNELGNK